MIQLKKMEIGGMMFKAFKKATRTMNKINAKAKDAEAVGNLLTGNTGKVAKRLKNKAKGKVVRKLWNKF